jgi:hypothetical protein
LYLSPIGGGQADIVYRNQRLYREGKSRSTAIGVPVVFSGDYTPAADELLNDATLDTDKLVDGETTGEFDFTLPAGYEAEGADFWIDLRTHEAGLENQSLYRPRHIIVGVGEESDAVLGTAALIRVVKLDGGDARIDFEYIASLSGAQPDSFTLRKLTGTGTIADVSVDFTSGQRDYSGTITGMTTHLGRQDMGAWGWHCCWRLPLNWWATSRQTRKSGKAPASRWRPLPSGWQASMSTRRG